MNRKTVYIKNGGKYAAQQRLAYSFAPLGSETVSTATITFLGETIEKRLLINSAGVFELLLSDVLDAIKTNTYSFKPFSDFALDEFKPLTIEGDFDAIAIEVLNAIDSPDSFANSGDFMSRNTEIQFDERFEQGFNFYGEIEIERETTDGADTLTIGQADELNFVSFRELLRLPSTPVITYYNGTTTGAVQGETATYEVTADNLTGNAGAVEVTIDFGGTIGTDSQIVTFAANETGKTIQFTKLIPSDEGTPRTAEVSDDVGSDLYSWAYAVEAYVHFTWATTASNEVQQISNLELNAPVLVEWGDGSEETISIDGIHTHEYTNVGTFEVKISSASNILELDISTQNVSSFNVDNATSLITFNANINDLVSASIKNSNILNLRLNSNALLSSVDISEATSVEFLNLSNCNLTVLDLTQNTALKNVDLIGNALTGVFDGTHLVNLETIKLQSNSLTKIDLSGITTLTNNGVGDTTFTDNQTTSLTELDLSGCTAFIGGVNIAFYAGFVTFKGNYDVLSTSLKFRASGLNQAGIDEVLNGRVASLLNNGTIRVDVSGGTIPSTTGQADIATLQSRGWSVTTN